MNAKQLSEIADEYNQNRPYLNIMRQAKQEAFNGNYMFTTAIKPEDKAVIEQLKENGFIVENVKDLGMVIMLTILFPSQRKHPQEGVMPSGETAYPA